MHAMKKATKSSANADDKHAVLDRFSSETAYKFGEALVRNIGFDTLNHAVEKEIRAFIRTKEFKRLVMEDIRKMLSDQTFRQFWAEDVLEVLSAALPKLASDISIRVTTKGRVQGRLG